MKKARHPASFFLKRVLDENIYRHLLIPDSRHVPARALLWLYGHLSQAFPWPFGHADHPVFHPPDDPERSCPARSVGDRIPQISKRRPLIIWGEILGGIGILLLWYSHRLPDDKIHASWVIIIGLTLVEIFWSMS